MDFNNIEFSGLKKYIEFLYQTSKDWDKVRNLEVINDKSVEDALSSFIGPTLGLSSDFLTTKLWNDVVDYMEKKDKSVQITKISQKVKSDASIPVDEYSTWQLYKKGLEKKHWSEKSIENIKKSSFEILQYLSMDTTNDGPVKGLVIGNVQSGKTANMAALMAMAADNGFNYFIILSGVIENLRQQTSTRLFNDMKSSGNGNLHWNQIEKPSLKSKLPEHNISKFNLGDYDKDRYFTVSLKNKGRLEALIKWLFSDINKAKQLKVLVIDDEADQASIKTKDITEEDTTAINGLIKKLVNTDKVKGMNYISYTATPYANVLNETTPDSLYPKDFIILLNPSEDYIGPRQLFGTEVPESSPYIDIIRDIPDSDREIIERIQKGAIGVAIPRSLKDSIHWFILTIAAMRAIDYHNPISMLVHTSFKISEHKNIANCIYNYLNHLKNNYESMLPELEELYENEALDFKRSYFLDGLRDYSTPDQVPDYPKWNVIKKYIDRLFRLKKEEFVSHIPIGEEGQPKFHKGIHLVIDNSQSKADDQIVRLVYPSKDKMPNVAPAFIVVGGNTLSRGLTLEGLTTTYFLRKTSQADTLMQMGRWFGYRKGYEVFPRVWLDHLALERYQFLSQMNEELREELEAYKGLTPADYAPRVKNSPNYKLIRITSSNKMQAAEAKEYDFAGFNTQTIYFEKDVNKLENNIIQTRNFLNGLGKPEVKKNCLVWREVGIEQIRNYLENYTVCTQDIKMSSLPALVEWAQKNSNQLSEWSVILASRGKISETPGEVKDWNIHGYYPNTSVRTRLKNRSTDKLVSIGSLRSPADLLADIEEPLTKDERKVVKPSEVQKVRLAHHYGKVPQIIIYRIDKGEQTEEEYRQKQIAQNGTIVRPNRAPLNFPEDLIGINIMIPGASKGGNLATYISAKLDVENDLDEYDEFEEDNPLI